MKKISLLFLGSVFLNLCVAQITYVTPTHLYNSLTEVTNSARADALGKNTITLDGIRSAFDNPASISPGKEKAQIALNYFSGHPFHFRSQNYFFGASYKATKRITVGVSTHQWIDSKAAWSSIIGFSETSTPKKSQQTYSLHGAVRLTDHLHFGISGNRLSYKAIEGITTSKFFLVNTGLIYDRPVQWLSESTPVEKENIRMAVGFTNLLFDSRTIERKNDSIWQYRDIPIILRLGVAYGFSMPLNIPFGNLPNQIKALPKTLEITARIQYNDWIKRKLLISDDPTANTLVGVGIEATALTVLTARLGYFRETRPTRDVSGEVYATTPVRKGLTWGLGLQIPAKLWTNDKLPFDFRFDILAKKHPNTLHENVSRATTSKFTDKKLLLGLGFEINF